VTDEPPAVAPAALANVLGALALVVTDEMVARVTEGAAGSVSDAAALSALSEFLDGATIDRVHRVLGLTPSGAVRLVDRLVESGLATRGAGPDGRSRAVLLTPAGRDHAARVNGARAAYLTSLLTGLAPGEVDELHRLLGRVLANVVDAKDGGAWTCRLCDLTACGRDQGRCPTANAAREKYAAEATGR
jgi:DNA-binding MarR family transcriptional regulator